MELCGDDCKGQYFSTHYAAAGAKGDTKVFIDRYKEKYGYTPDDVAALTWDATRLVLQAIQGMNEWPKDLKASAPPSRTAWATSPSSPASPAP